MQENGVFMQMKTAQPTPLAADKTLEILSELPMHMLQGRRMVEFLSQNPKTSTGVIASECSIGNLSDVAHYVNKYLRKHNLIIGCEKPIKPILNKFKERSNQFLWSIYDVPSVANDDNFNTVIN